MPKLVTWLHVHAQHQTCPDCLGGSAAESLVRLSAPQVLVSPAAGAEHQASGAIIEPLVPKYLQDWLLAVKDSLLVHGSTRSQRPVVLCSHTDGAGSGYAEPRKRESTRKKNSLDTCIAEKSPRAVWATVMRSGVAPQLFLTKTLGRARH